MGCSKEQYNTFKLAKAAAKAIMKRIKDYARPYKCQHCGQYHLTTQVKNRLKKPEKKKKYPLKDVVRREVEKFPEAKINIGYRPEKIILNTDTIGKKLK